MPYRPRDIYRGHRKFRVPTTIILSILCVLIVGGVVLFYGLQQYLVYDQNGVSLQLPFMGGGTAAVAPESENTAPAEILEPVQVEVVYDDPDFSDVDLGGWESLAATQALFVSYDDAAQEQKLSDVLDSVSSDDYTGLVLELKSEAGQLAWPSASELAVSYGTAGTMDYTDTVAAIHEKNMTAAAQISCCADSAMATRNWPLALQSAPGVPYQDGDRNYWLDPYNRTVRNYLADLVRELAAMGFDEIILSNLYHPVSESAFTYSVTIQTTPDPVAAVCAMGRRLAESLSGTETAVSALIDADSMRNASSAQTGQDLEIFWRLFARLYCPSNVYNSSSDIELATSSLTQGDASVRLALVCPYTPENVTSYVIAAPET